MVFIITIDMGTSSWKRYQKLLGKAQIVKKTGRYKSSVLKFGVKGDPIHDVALVEVSGQKFLFTPSEKNRAAKRAKEFMKTVNKAKKLVKSKKFVTELKKVKTLVKEMRQK